MGYIVLVFIFISEFYVKVSEVGYILPTTHQNTFIFGPWVPWTVWFHIISFGPRVHVPWGAGGQSLGNFKKCYIAFSFMPTPSYDIMSAVRHPYDVKVSVTYISWLNDFA